MQVGFADSERGGKEAEQYGCVPLVQSRWKAMLQATTVRLVLKHKRTRVMASVSTLILAFPFAFITPITDFPRTMSMSLMKAATSILCLARKVGKGE